MSEHSVLPEDLVLYAMGSLDAQEMGRVRAHIENCIACNSELQKINGDLGLLAMSIQEKIPPAALKQRLMAEISHSARTSNKAASNRTIEKRTAVPLFWKIGFAIASLLVILVVMLLLQSNSGRRYLAQRNAALESEITQLQDETREARRVFAVLHSPDAIRVSLTLPTNSPQPSVQAVFSKKERRVFLVASHLPTLPSGIVYQLWILPPAGSPISVGIFMPNRHGDAQLLLPEISSETNIKGFALTREPGQGSSAPTSKPILVGNIS